LGISVISFLSFITIVYGQAEAEELMIRRVEIWALFYRLMIVAFIVGAVVQGTIIYVCWRFRESHKKNQVGNVEAAHK
jgi:heme/copper-type cytochrome/quinol oxidase subunit 2